MTVRRWRTCLAVVAAAAAVLAGCGGDEQRPRRTPAAASADPSLLAKADLQRCPEVADEPATGDDALPAVTLPCLGDGPAVSLRGLRGPLVLNLWATWCEPCRAEAPLFQRLHAAGKQVTVMGVDSKDRSRDAALAFAGDRGLRYPSLYDQKGRTMAAARAGNGLPITLFVDRRGTVTHRKIGPYETYGELTDDVEEHLGMRA